MSVFTQRLIASGLLVVLAGAGVYAAQDSPDQPDRPPAYILDDSPDVRDAWDLLETGDCDELHQRFVWTIDDLSYRGAAAMPTHEARLFADWAAAANVRMADLDCGGIGEFIDRAEQIDVATP